MEESIVQQAEAYAREVFSDAEAGHGWWHTDRVRQLALHIARSEGNCDLLTVELGALLHDIADAKFNGGDEEEGPRRAREFLASQSLADEKIEAVIHIIRYSSFRKRDDKRLVMTPELAAVTDADRLDAMGATGIARAFHYGGYRNRSIAESDTGNMESTISHFHEKLMLLKDLMHTGEGRRLAEARHHFMEAFLDQFTRETVPGKSTDNQ